MWSRNRLPIVAIIGTVVVLLASLQSDAQTVLRVKSDSTGASDGSSWADAFTHPQAALAAAAPIAGGGTAVQIWIAAGTYMPDGGQTPVGAPHVSGTGDRSASFQLVNNASLYGGFAGTETSLSQRTMAHAAMNETILSGDLNGDDGPNFSNRIDNSYCVVRAMNVESTTVLDGINVQGGHGWDRSGGLDLSNSPMKVVGCTFSANESYYGGAVSCDSFLPALFVRCNFSGNRATSSGGALYLPFAGSAHLHHCRFVGNVTTSSNGGAVYSESFDLIFNQCIFSRNKSSQSGGAVFDSIGSGAYKSCVLYGNECSDGNSAIDSESGSFSLEALANCIVWNNLDNGFLDYDPISIPLTSSTFFSCLQGNFGNTGTIYVDPLFVNPAGTDGLLGTLDDDFSLSPNSPCIDAGSNLLLPADVVDEDGDGDVLEAIPLDITGMARVVNTPSVFDTGIGGPPVVDIGAIELGGHGFKLSRDPVQAPEGGFDVLKVSLIWQPAEDVEVSIENSGGDIDVQPASTTLTFSPNNFRTPQPVVIEAAEDPDVLNGTAYVRLTIPGATPAIVTVVESDNDALTPVLRVRQEATGLGTGANWEDAITDLSTALALAADPKRGVCEIWVANGTYKPDQGTGFRGASFRLIDGVAIYGGFAGTESTREQRDPRLNPTILSGDLSGNDGPGLQNNIENSYHVVLGDFNDPSAVVDGFSVSGGNANSTNTFENYGGGLRCLHGRPTILNCRFTGNYAIQGGGVSVQENYDVATGWLTISNCRFDGNYAKYGGGFAKQNATVAMVNCRFIGNLAEFSGGGLLATNGPGVTNVSNCVFVGNSAHEGGAIAIIGYPFFLNGSTIFGNSAVHGGGCWSNFGSAQPLFIFNSIIRNNIDQGGTNETAQIRSLAAPITGNLFNNCIQGWTGALGGVGNFDADPQFVDPDGIDDIAGTVDDDLRLSAGSLCIDRAGQFPLRVLIDIDGNRRSFDDPTMPNPPDGSLPVDIGAFEFGSPPMPSRIYVSSQGSSGGTGLSWTDAIPSLQIALLTAGAMSNRNIEIWAASGTYHPSSPGDRFEYFRCLSWIQLYGGFSGTESEISERDPANLAVNPTVLSGDLAGDDGPAFAGYSENALHVLDCSGSAQTSLVDGVTIRGGYAQHQPGLPPIDGGGILLTRGRPLLRNIRIEANLASAEAGGMLVTDSEATLDNVAFAQNSAPLAECSIIQSGKVSLLGPMTIADGSLLTRGATIEGAGGIALADNSVLRIAGFQSSGATRLRTTITGLGDIVIDAGQVLQLEAGAVVDLSGQLPNQGCADPAQSLNWGRILVNGLLVLTDSTVQNANVDVLLADLQGVTYIVNNDCHLLSLVNGSTNSVPFGGEFFVSGNSVVQCNVIESDGDRYLDLDPDPNANPRPTIGQGSTGNKISVNIRQGAGLDQGELLELRSVDHDHPAFGGQSGAWQLATSAGDTVAGGGGYTDTWVLEKLEVFPNAKVNLTNRQGFVFQSPAITIPEAMYVKKIKLHPGAVLNTGLQRMYYQTLVDENDTTLTVNPNDPHALLANGSRMVDVPLLGFSLKVIAMEDETEFAVRLRTRLRDANDVQPPAPPFKEGEVVRVAAPIPNAPTNHAMAMRTSKTDCPPSSPPCPSASSIAVHGAFARSGEDEIEVKFNYKFCGQASDELVVYLSDAPDVLSGSGPSADLIEVARLYPPASGPGSIASSDFASFSGRFARGTLNFTRGTYVELELRGVDACILIDDFDPVVCLWCACGDFSGEGACGVESLDYLYLLSEYGNSVNATNLCADQMGQDHYVDLSDLMNWSSGFHDPTMLNLCDGTAGASSGSALASTVPGGLVIAGKPSGEGQNDSLYSVNTQTNVAGTAIPSPGQHNGQRSGNGPLVKDNAGNLHQLHGVMGLIRLSDGAIRLAPKTFSNVSLPNVTTGSTVRVGLTSGGGYALLDAAFDPSDPSGNALFVLPIQVDPPGANGSGCPYRAAAKVQLTGNGNCNLISIHGLNPAIGSSVVSTSTDCSEIVFSPDASRLRELDVDGFGNLFVISAQGVNDYNYVLIHPTGTTNEIRVLLTGQVQAPTALHVNGDWLYISTSLDGPDATDTVIHRYAIIRSGNAASGLDTSPAGHKVITIPGIRFLTSITTNTTDNKLYATGFGSLSCSREACNADPDCPLGCHFNPGDPIFTTPMLASITNPTTATPTVTTSPITGSTLGLPISIAFTGTTCGSGDLDNNGQTNPADIAPFVQALFDPTPAALCPADINHDNTLNGEDVQQFVQRLISG